jgi:hypothetical protein
MHFKKRDMGVLDYIYKQSGGRHGINMFGDVEDHFLKAPEFYDERLKQLKMIDVR